MKPGTSGTPKIKKTGGDFFIKTCQKISKPNPLPRGIPSCQRCKRVAEARSKCHRLIGGTSSTAQGGGGSFKNRKPIGDVGCCESRMAERIH